MLNNFTKVVLVLQKLLFVSFGRENCTGKGLSLLSFERQLPSEVGRLWWSGVVYIKMSRVIGVVAGVVGVFNVVSLDGAGVARVVGVVIARV